MVLIINNTQVEMPEDFSIKITRENPYFSSSGDYTFDIELPLLGSRRNQLALGTLHRPEQAIARLAGEKFDMRLFTPGLLLTGYALVTAIDNEKAKLQLVAGRSAFDKAIEGKEEYIDRMELGRAWDTFPDRAPWDIFSGGEAQDRISKDEDPFRLMPTYIRSLYAENAYAQEAVNMVQGEYPKTDCVCLPIYSKEDEKVCNELSTDDGDGTRWLPRADVTAGMVYNTPCAPQPYLLDVIDRIIRAAGYTSNLTRFTRAEATEQEMFIRRIIVANVRCTPLIAQMLPHWTLREFVEAVQDALGVVFVLHGEKVVSMVPRAGWFAQNGGVEIRPEDEHDVDVDNSDEAAQDTSSAGNVGYDFPEDDAQLSLPEEVWQYANVIKYDNITQLRNAAAALKPEERTLSQNLYINKEDGRCYAYLHDAANPSDYKLTLVNHYGPLLREEKAADNVKKLLLVPLAMKLCRMTYPTRTGSEQIYDTPQKLEPYAIPILSTTDTCRAGRENYSIDIAVNPDDNGSDNTAGNSTDNEEGKLSFIPLAYYDPTARAYRKTDHSSDPDDNIPLAVGLTFLPHETNGHRTQLPNLVLPAGMEPEGPFRLTHGSRDAIQLSALLEGSATIDTRTQFTFSFLGNETDPTLPYLIHSKRYACRKLELTLTPQGISPLKKGYFHEINP